VLNPLNTDSALFATQSQMKALEGKMHMAIEMIEEKFDSTRVLDIYSFANQSERADHASNLSKLNLVLITGSYRPTLFIDEFFNWMSLSTFIPGMRSEDFPYRSCWPAHSRNEPCQNSRD